MTLTHLNSFSLLLLVLYTGSVDAQVNLYRPVNNKAFDNLMIRQQRFYEKSSFDSAHAYAQAGLQFAQQVHSKPAIATAYLFLGQCLTYMNRYASAKTALDSSIHLAAELHNNMLLARSYYTLAAWYNYRSQNNEAMYYCLKTDSLIQNSGDTSLYVFLPTLYSGMGYFFDQQQQFDKSILYHRKAYEMMRHTNDSAVFVMIYQNYFVHYMNNGQRSQAIQYLDSAARLNKGARTSLREVYILSNYGWYYKEEGQYHRALDSLLKGLKICTDNGIAYFKNTIKIDIAKLYMQLGAYNQAFTITQSAVKDAKHLNDLVDVVTGYELLSNIKRSQKEFSNALLYTDSFHVYVDSLNLQETKERNIELETKYQTAQKEKEIASLSVAKAQGELEVVRRNRLLIIGSISAAGLLVLLLLLYRFSKQQQKLAEKEKLMHQQQIHTLEQEQHMLRMQSMIEGQEAERSRIAKDLHDGLGGLFSTMKMYLSSLLHEKKELKESALFGQSYEMVNTAADEVRRIAHNMMPDVLVKLGLLHALQDLCASFNQGGQLQVRLMAYGVDDRLPASTEIMIYRILQELLNNIFKHSAATEALVQVNHIDEIFTLTVEDNGKGFDVNQTQKDLHAGLETVKSRVAYLEGELSIDSLPGTGTSITIQFGVNK